MFVLGIDPGLSRCGYGAVRSDRGRQEAVAYGVLRTDHTDLHASRLASMNRQLRALIADLRPEVVVVERVFFQNNARTAVGVAQASGLALAAAFDADAVVAQYSSNEVKQAVAGFGAADKGQVQRMVQRILALDELPKPADAADALALALHHLAVAPFAAAGAGATVLQRLEAELGASDRSGKGVRTSFGNARIASSVGGGVRVVQGVAKGAAQGAVP